MSNDAQSATSAPPAGLSAAKKALLAKWLRNGPSDAKKAGGETIPRRRNPDPAPLSLEQQRLWFFHQLEPDSALYTMPIASRLRGKLQPRALQQAMDLIVARHEALRTRLVGHDPVQTIDPPSGVPMLSWDLRELPPAQREAEAKRLLEAEAKRPFNLSSDLMIRTALLRLDEEEWIFLVLMHHVASDDWSWRVFCNEVASAYEAIISGRKAELPEPAIQYADFSLWQQETWRGDTLEKHLAYWRKQLDGAPPVLELPADHPRPASQTFRGACEWMKLSPALSEKLNALSQGEGFTPFMILLAGFQTLLHRYTGQVDIVVGSPVAGRTRAVLEKVIGVFVNMLVLRTKLEGNPSFTELLRRTQTTVLEALAQQDLPFEKLVEQLQPQRSASYSPLIQVMFALQDELSDNLHLPGLTTGPFPLDTRTAKFDLTFTIVKSGSNFDCCAEYNSDLFEAATVRRMLGHYQTLLEAVAANREQRLSDLPLLTDVERTQLLVDWNRTESDFPRDKCVHELFAAQAAATPDAIAVVCGKRTLTYGELNRRANQLANHLQHLGIGPESLVGISMDRSPEMIVALLGILKAGGAYVPLDPSYPAERVQFMLEDSKASLLLTGSTEKRQISESGNLRTICLNSEWSELSRESDDTPRVEMNSENLAYVIYTSGSTGQPKGVQIPHRAVVNFLHSMRQEPGLAAADTLLSVTSISFDIAALEIFLPLTVGARIILATADEVFDAARMKILLRESGATAMQATPSFWQFLVEAGWAGDKRLKIFCGGEALSRALADKLLGRGAELWNLYGPTETTIWSTMAEITAGAEPISIGLPIANTQVYLLDCHLQPVPIGIPGELYIGGEGVARGYLNRPELTAERFIANPFLAAQSKQSRDDNSSQNWSNFPLSHQMGEGRGEGYARIYKTGDVARYLPDGRIECLGRNDFQVKLRGHRIDLGEIESAMRRHADVSEAVVSLNEDASGQKRLIAYLTGTAGTSPRTGEHRTPNIERRTSNEVSPGTLSTSSPQPSPPLRGGEGASGALDGSGAYCASLVGESSLQSANLQQFLKTKLPDYMVPSAFVVLDKFPLTPNGKINRKALPDPAPDRAESKQAFVPPRTATEETLAQLWQEVLRLPRVGIHDNFFEIGGHSLLAMQFTARVHNSFQTELSLRNIFEAPTIAELANLVDRNRRQPAKQIAPPLPRARRISPEHARELLGKLDELSDTEVESLLQQVSTGAQDQL